MPKRLIFIHLTITPRQKTIYISINDYVTTVMSHKKRDELRTLIDATNRTVIFTGAGISTESGIPDFRSPGSGLWTKQAPIQFSEFVGSDPIRQESWRRRFSGDDLFENASPNNGHKAVAKLIREKKATTVITQNVDNLHQQSGVPGEQIIELHGNSSYASCLSCKKRYELSVLKSQFRRSGSVLPCKLCGGIIKTATISFGQQMPEIEMNRAHEVSLSCTLFLVLGSSLQVFPAAGFPEIAKQNGAKLVIVNRDPTPLDALSDLSIHEEIGPTMSYVTQLNQAT